MTLSIRKKDELLTTKYFESRNWDNNSNLALNDRDH